MRQCDPAAWVIYVRHAGSRGDLMSAPRARILYIDDDPGLCRLVQKDLERQGYVVEIATDGASGLARIAQGGIDVVALDHYMPNQDGLETLASIRNLAEPPPVIYVTAMQEGRVAVCLLYTSPSPRDGLLSRMPSSA